jgi:cysteine protease ATG4
MKLMTRMKSGGSGDGDGTEESNNHATERKGHNDPLLLLVDEIDDPLRQPTATSRNHQSMTHDGTIESTTDIVEWDTSLLLLLPLRLGIHNISISDYGSTLAKLIAFPHSVGLLGGTPRHALWFYGADATYPPPVVPLPSLSSAKPVAEKFSSDQDCVVGGWYGLDPHTVQLAPRGTRVLVEQSSSTSSRKNNLSNIDDANKATYQWQVQITDTYLRSLHISPTASHPNNQRSIPLSKLDPSCALGFYIRDHADFVHFQHLIKSLSEEYCRPNKLPDKW